LTNETGCRFVDVWVTMRARRRPTRGGMMSGENVDLVRRHFEQIWNERDPSACDELMAEDFVENGAAPFAVRAPGRVEGPTAMRGTVQWLISQFPDLTFEIEAIVADGDLVVARVRSRGTNMGRLNGFLPPSGKEFEYAQSHWFRVADGKLAEHWATRDDLSAMLQLGVVTPPRFGALLRQLRWAIPYFLRRKRLGRQGAKRS
jgi:predicted ester cyclase